MNNVLMKIASFRATVLQSSKNQGLANYRRGSQSIIVSKVLLEHGYAHLSLCIVYGCLCTAKTERNSCNRPYIADTS